MPPPELPEDRRVVPRRLAKPGVQVACRIGTLGLGQNIAVSLYDISEAGLRLSVSAPLAKDQEIEIELVAPGRSRPLKLSAKVIWCGPSEDGAHWVGAEFRRQLSYADICDLIRT
jgi:PilZ domain